MPLVYHYDSIFFYLVKLCYVHISGQKNVDVVMFFLGSYANQNNVLAPVQKHSPYQNAQGLCTLTLEGDKTSMLTHTCPHKSLRMIEVAICNH